MRSLAYIIICVLLTVSYSSKALQPQAISDILNLAASKYYTHSDSLPYTTLYFYRSYIPKMNAPMKKIPLYVNDTLITELKANTAVTYKIYKEGRINIAIDRKAETQFPVKVKFGKHYFFRCEVEKGLWFGKPTIEAVPEKVGREESGILDKS